MVSVSSRRGSISNPYRVLPNLLKDDPVVDDEDDEGEEDALLFAEPLLASKDLCSDGSDLKSVPRSDFHSRAC